MKKIFLFIVLFVAFGTASLAQCTVDIFINGVKAGQISLKANQEFGGLSYKKSTYRHIDKLTFRYRANLLMAGITEKYM